MDFTKPELMDYFKQIPRRWAKNRLANGIFSVYFAPILTYMDRKLTEEQLKDYWAVIFDIVKDMETANKLKAEAKEHPRMQVLANNAENKLKISIMTPMQSTYDSKKVLEKALATMQYGGMRE